MRMHGWLLGAPLLLLACSSGTEATRDAGPTETLGPRPDAGFIPTLAGTYAVKIEVNGTQRAVNKEFKSKITSYGLVRITRNASGFTWEESVCHTETTTENGEVHTEIDDAVPQSEPPINVPLTVTEDAEFTHWSRPKTTIALGWNPSSGNPETEGIPQTASDPRVVDQDNDTHPGVTMHMNGDGHVLFGPGANPNMQDDLYVVQDVRCSYTGEVSSPTRLLGRYKDEGTKQTILGDSGGLFAFVGDVQNTFEEDTTKNPMILVKVADTMDCPTVSAQRDTLGF